MSVELPRFGVCSPFGNTRSAENVPTAVIPLVACEFVNRTLRDAGRADVHTARVKEVKKPRGAKPGLVTLSGGKTLHVRMQPERLQRLLSREGQAPTPPGT